MIGIKDIYQWYDKEYNHAPKPSEGLTPLQNLEWQEENSKAISDYKQIFMNKSFIGELLKAPAEINSIGKSEIWATAYYHELDMNNFNFKKEKYSDDRDIAFDEYELAIEYKIIFDESLYKDVRLIYNYNMIEITGQILNFSKEIRVNKEWADYKTYTSWYIIKLNLITIKVINKELLYADLLYSNNYIQEHLKAKQNAKNKKSLDKAILDGFSGGFMGGFLGLFVGFFRSCSLSTNEFFHSGIFLPTLLFMIILGVIIGAIIGIMSGQLGYIDRKYFDN